MKKIIVASDSFKGSLSSMQIGREIQDAAARLAPDLNVTIIPVSDGGEGLVEALTGSAGFQAEPVNTYDPYFTPLTADFARRRKTAVIELAACSGLLLCDPQDPSATSTYGTGLQLKAALDQGCTELLLGLGGSGMQDAGCGIAAALGVRFFHKGQTFLPLGETLDRIDSIDMTGLHPRLKAVSLTCLCDVDNPACGPRGAAAVFARQKGAGEEMIRMLDRNTQKYGELLEELTGRQILNKAGAGAAGACGLSLFGLLNAEMLPGLPQVLKWNDFERHLKDADWVITGEGSLDAQSKAGKVPYGVLEAAKRYHVPVLALCGRLAADPQQLAEDGFAEILPINPADLPLKQCLAEARPRLKAAVEAWLVQKLNKE